MPRLGCFPSSGWSRFGDQIADCHIKGGHEGGQRADRAFQRQLHDAERPHARAEVDHEAAQQPDHSLIGDTWEETGDVPSSKLSDQAPAKLVTKSVTKYQEKPSEGSPRTV